ncbi:peptidoglycan-binding protein [Streptomyces sp. NBC_00659]|uniref:peptidoglycan-binding protein n=1 Tax=Streptomyces sp. NBC_00659 TaxID=2903669 RepID=UPI002E2FEBCC|nr:peptidoglycan-binding protein [Streptomyces sp. NBC_00659]
MTEPTGHVCPECAAHRAQDGTPSCACTRRASDALRDERSAQAAAAEDFNPLRIRPYVELGPEYPGPTGGGWEPAEGAGAPGPAGAAMGPWQAAPTAGEPWMSAEAGTWASEGTSAPVSAYGASPGGGGWAADAMPVNGDDPRFHGGAPAGGAEPTGSVAGAQPAGGMPMPAAGGEDAAASTMQLAVIPADATMRLAPVPADAAPRSAPLPPEAATPSAPMPADATMRLKALPSEARATDVRLFHENARASGPGQEASPAGRARRRRRSGVLAVTGVVVTVVAAAGVASGLLSYDPPARDEAHPKDVRASAPDVLSDTASAVPSASASSSESASASASASPSTSPSPSASESDASASPSSSATASATSAHPSPTATATGSVASTGSGGSNEVAGPTLRRGDSGSEVTELQLRLSRLRMYMRKADGQFDRRLEDAVRWYQWARGISGDEPGVYGPATRASLEAETSQP